MPVLDRLRVVIEISVAGYGGPTVGECLLRLFAGSECLTNTLPEVQEVDGVQEYRDIFLKVKDWENFQESDIERNRIEEAENITIPAFVTTFERMLLRKPCLSPDVRCVPDSSVYHSMLTVSVGHAVITHSRRTFSALPKFDRRRPSGGNALR